MKNVTGLHFICRRDLGVEQLADGLFRTGDWKVDEKHLATVEHVALHERRDEPSYLQGELVDFERSAKTPDRLVLRVRASADAIEWPARSGTGERVYCRSGAAHGRPLRTPNSLMFECEAKLLFKIDGQKEWRWEKRPVARLAGGTQRSIRCEHCHGAVRVHRQRVPHGPADHVEHLHRSDATHCRGGHDFCGTHSMSANPVE